MAPTERENLLGRQQRRAEHAPGYAAVDLRNAEDQLDMGVRAGMERRIEAVTCELLEHERRLQEKEAALLSETAGLDAGVTQARWNSLASERSLLQARWTALVEDKRLVTLTTRKNPSQLSDFEPGTSEVHDLYCAIVTHQMDVPFFSCCFQR